tara:strand:+ start:92479 stop:93426 length:948 start_codon:yes stop_codon:yes gene_type:complete
MITKILLTLLIAGGILFTTPQILEKYHSVTKLNSESNVANVKMPEKSILESKLFTPKLKPASKTLTLEAKNTVTYRGPVTSKSASAIQGKILALSHKLSKKTPIYLILNTPGGSVGAGLDLIDFMRAIPQKVHTITLFAASMGFQIAQNMDIRYITPNGTLMSHRAKLSGFGGQLDGEFESRYAMIKRKVDYLDAIAAKRMSITVKQYKKLIINEYWVHGFDSVEEVAADEMVNVRCGKSMKGSTFQDFRTMFGTAVVEFSKCPLIQAPLSVGFKNVKAGKANKLKNLTNAGFINKRKYVKDYILTGEHNRLFGL